MMKPRDNRWADRMKRPPWCLWSADVFLPATATQPARLLINFKAAPDWRGRLRALNEADGRPTSPRA